MPFRILDSVLESSTTTGTGALTVAGAETGCLSFSGAGVAVNDTFPYRITGVDTLRNATGEWETGIGTYSSSNTITRTKVLASSNSNAAVSFSAGTKLVSISDIAAIVAASEVIAPSGVKWQAMPDTGRCPLSYWSPTNNSTTVPVVQGLAAFTTVGTATARAVASTNAATMLKRLGYASAAGAGSLASHYQNSAVFFPGDATYLTSGFFYSAQFVPSDPATVAGARMFVGIGQNTSAPTNVDPSTLTNSIGVAQISTDTTQLYLCYGGSSAQTAVALGATDFPGQTLSTSAFEISIYSPAAQSSTYYVTVRNLGSGVSKSFVLTGASAVVPQAGTALAPRSWRTNNATALAVGLDVGVYRFQTGI